MLNFIIFFTVLVGFESMVRLGSLIQSIFNLNGFLCCYKTPLALSIDCKTRGALNHFPWGFFSILSIRQLIGGSYKHDGLYFSRDFLYALQPRRFQKRKKVFKASTPPAQRLCWLISIHAMNAKEAMHSDLLFSRKNICCQLSLLVIFRQTTTAMTTVTDFHRVFF